MHKLAHFSTWQHCCSIRAILNAKSTFSVVKCNLLCTSFSFCIPSFLPSGETQSFHEGKILYTVNYDSCAVWITDFGSWKQAGYFFPPSELLCWVFTERNCKHSAAIISPHPHYLPWSPLWWWKGGHIWSDYIFEMDLCGRNRLRGWCVCIGEKRHKHTNKGRELFVELFFI